MKDNCLKKPYCTWLGPANLATPSWTQYIDNTPRYHIISSICLIVSIFGGIIYWEIIE